ncbi:unnamed protein product [Acanthoscelides obtectus]|uniref:Zinc finger BED domain-containing protein 5 n=1 Tax=Acanthoscelides obtectus TaxID=200917 RepID=A0A9P0LCW3_ACAOB|nr:unnamed protein product [Acanthoscelides obtectus]CAK1659600.1 Protein ZBED8 [Acanthoscelides obtectus]
MGIGRCLKLNRQLPKSTTIKEKPPHQNRSGTHEQMQKSHQLRGVESEMSNNVRVPSSAYALAASHILVPERWYACLCLDGRGDFNDRTSREPRKRPTLNRMFVSTSQRNDDGLRASYNISLLIAKSGKPHTIGEKLILPAVEEVLKTILHKPASDIIKRIPLSNNTVERRIDEMSSDIESFLCYYLQTTHFSIQLDESTLPDNAALLLAYVRFIMNQEIYEELLFARTLIADTKGESMFHVLKDYFIEKAIPLSNIISVATDGAPAVSFTWVKKQVKAYLGKLH